MYARNLAYPIAGNFAYGLTELPAYRGGGIQEPVSLLIQPFITTILSNQATQEIDEVVPRNTVIFPNGVNIEASFTDTPPALTNVTIALSNSQNVKIERAPLTIIGRYSGEFNGTFDYGIGPEPVTGAVSFSFDPATGEISYGRITGLYSDFGFLDTTLINGEFSSAIGGLGTETGTISGSITNNNISGSFAFVDVPNGGTGEGSFDYPLAPMIPAPGSFSGTAVGTVDNGEGPVPADGVFYFNYEPLDGYPLSGYLTNGQILNFYPTNPLHINLDNVYVTNGVISTALVDGVSGVGIGSFTGTITGNTVTGEFSFEDGDFAGQGTVSATITYPSLDAAYTAVQFPSDLVRYTERKRTTLETDDMIKVINVRPFDVAFLAGSRTDIGTDDFVHSASAILSDTRSNTITMVRPVAGIGSVTVDGTTIKFQDGVLATKEELLKIIPAGQDTIDIALDTPVNPLYTMLFLGGVGPTAATTPDKSFAYAYLLDGNTVRLVRSFSDDSADIIVIITAAQFFPNILTVQRGQTTIEEGEDSAEASFGEVIDLGVTFPNYLGFSTTEENYTPHTYLPIVEIMGTGNLAVRRAEASTSTVTTSWEVVSIAPPSPRPLFLQPFVTTLIAKTADETISPTGLNTTVLFYNGVATGEDMYPMSSSATVTLTDASTVHVQRDDSSTYVREALPVTQDFAIIVAVTGGLAREIGGLASIYITNGGTTTHYTGSFTAFVDGDNLSVNDIEVSGGGYTLSCSGAAVESLGDAAYSGSITGDDVDSGTVSGILRGDTNDYLDFPPRNQISGVINFTGTNGDEGVIYFDSYNATDSVGFSGTVSGTIDDGVEPTPATGNAAFTYDPIGNIITDAQITDYGGPAGYNLNISNITVGDNGEWEGDVSDVGSVSGSANGKITGSESTLSLTFNDGDVTGEGSGTLSIPYPEIDIAYTVAQLPSGAVESTHPLLITLDGEETRDVMIPAVDLSRSVIVWGNLSSNSDSGNWNDSLATIEFISDNYVRVTRGTSNGKITLAAAILTFQAAAVASVQHVNLNYVTVSSLLEVPIEEVDPTRTLTFYGGYRLASASNAAASTCMIDLKDSTTLRAECGTSGGSLRSAKASVVEFNPGIISVQRGRTVIEAGDASTTASISPVFTDRSFANWLGYTTNAAGPIGPMASVILNASDEVLVTRNNAVFGIENAVSWEVIEAI